MESRDSETIVSDQKIKKNPTFRFWMFTWNNPGEDWKTKPTAFEADYSVFQLERGEEGTVHIQGLLYYTIACRATKFKGIPCWIKGITKQDASNRVQQYVTKQETRLDGPIENGSKPKSLEARIDHYVAAMSYIKEGRITEIFPRVLISHFTNIQKLAVYLSTEYSHTGCRGLWFTGPTGSGKSRESLDLCNRLGFTYFRKTDLSQFLDGYNGHQAVIIDDLDRQGINMGHDLKIWADRYPFKFPIKHGYVQATHRILIVTSNYRIETLWEGDADLIDSLFRRFKVYEFPLNPSVQIIL